MSRNVYLATLIALGLVATACAEEPTPTQQAANPDQIVVAGEEANDHGTQDIAGTSDFELEAYEFYFQPTVLSGEAGQTITLEVLNEGEQSHTFTLDALKVDLEVPPGQNATTKVTFPDSGAFLFYCRFHAGGAMRGGLSVGGDLEAAAGTETGGGGGDERTGPYG
jgi:plastocyanin